MIIKKSMLFGGGGGAEAGWLLCDTSCRVASSPDGLNWKVRTTPWTDDGTHWISSVASSPDGTWVLGLDTLWTGGVMNMAYGGPAFVYSSTDQGATWTQVLASAADSGVLVFYLHDAFFACEHGYTGYGTSRTRKVHRSVDGVTWTQVASNSGTYDHHCMAYGDGVWAMGGGSQNNQYNNPPQWSDDGITWQNALSGGTPYGSLSCSHGASFGGGYFFCMMMRSNDGSWKGSHRTADGKNWSQAQDGRWDYHAGAGANLYRNPRGSYATPSYSSDGGVTWNPVTGGVLLNKPIVGFFDGRYVMVDCACDHPSTPNSNYFVSDDGIDFTGYPKPPGMGDLMSVCPPPLAA